MTANTKPGFFVGWRLESGLRYRGVLKILDNDDVIQNKTISSRSLKDVPEAEVYFPEELTFPFAERRKLAIRQMQDPSSIDFPVPAIPDELPFSEGVVRQGGDQALYDLPKRVRREFNITIDRIIKYDPTPGCKACDRAGTPGLHHTAECVARFRSKMQADGTLPMTTITTVAPVEDVLLRKDRSSTLAQPSEHPAPLDAEEDEAAMHLETVRRRLRGK